MKSKYNISRRTMLGATAAGVALGLSTLSRASKPDLPVPPSSSSPGALARDEDFWADVATYYDRTVGIVNLEHGYWGKMARPVQSAYLDATRMVNAQLSYYARKDYQADARESVRRVASALGVQPDEIVLTRNATEAIDAVIRQYRGLEPGDAVLYADPDYPAFKRTMRWLGDARGVRPVEVTIPPRADQAEILKIYRAAIDANPKLKLVLVTHVSNQHGLTFPVREISAECRQRGIDLLCDSAQSWGLLDYQLPDLDVDWAGFNLHKWIGSPVGVGALYLRRGSFAKIEPYPGEHDPENTDASARINVATSNFAAVLAIPAALDFHEAIGAANKEARLRYLRGLWTSEADQMPHIEVLGGRDEPSWTGMGSIRIAGKRTAADAAALQQRLEQDFGIFTVTRGGLDSGHCVRVTPQVFTTPVEVEKLVDALKRLA